jgi:copper chaperone CopZ
MIRFLGSLILVAGLGLALVPQGRSQGSAPAAYTAIVVEKMHCDNCAKRIGGQLQAVPGVAKIQYDVQKKTFWVHPQPGQVVSPRGLWEAIEKGEDRPIVLQGPSGTFNQKP